MGCACGKPGDVAMVGYKNPAATVYFGASSNLNASSSHIRITNLTVNKKPDVYLGALEEKINITRKTYTYKPNDYLQILQELRATFFQYLDQRTVIQDDRGRPVSARYRKAMDWKLYENFEREFASELYRRRHEQITRQELYDLFETYIQSTHINLRPEHLQTDGHDDRREYIGQILIIPSTSTTNKVENYAINNNDNDSSSSSSESESRSSKTKESTNHVKSRRISMTSIISSSSSSDSNSEMIPRGAKKKRIAVTTRLQSRGSSSSSSSDSNSETESISDKKPVAVVRFKEDANSSSSSISSGTESSKTPKSTEQVVDYELMLEGEFQRISGEGISADEYILLLLLYSQALEELRNRQQGQEKENVISNLKNNFLTRRIMIEQLKETRQQKEKESRIPDTKGYTEAADKELKENEDNMKKVIETNSTETETGDSQSEHEKQLLDFINKQTALIKKLEEERENEIKQLEAEIAATQTTDTSTDNSDIGGEETDASENQSKKEQKQIEKAMDKSHKKLKKAIIEDSSDKKKIKKKLKKIRKKLKETMEEVDGKRLKRLETIEEEKEENADLPDDIEDKESYGNMADKELLRDNDLLLDNIKRLRVLREHDMEEFEKQKKDLNDRLENETKLMLQMEEKRNERLEQTQTDIIDRKLKEMNRKCLKNILKDVTDDERIKQILEQHRKDQTNLATEVDSNRLRQRELLKQRLRELREKQGLSAEDENETSMFDMIRSTDDFSTDFDKELETEMDELLVALKDIDSSDSDSTEKRRNMIEQHLNQIENTFKRLDSDRNDIVNNIKRSTNVEEELVDDLNTEFVKMIEESIDTCDDEMAGRKLQEHRLRQRKLLEDMDSDRIQKRNLLAQKLRQMKTKPAVDDQTRVPPVMETDKYLEAIDKELQCNEEDLIEFLTKDTSDMNEENREKDISDKLEEFVGRQKQLVGRYESERREKILEAAKGPTIDVPSNLNDMNGWLKRSLLNGNTQSEEDVKDKLAEYRKKQKKLLEDVDSKRLQQKKILQLKLKKLREEKELKDAETSAQNTDADNLIQDIAAITGTDQELAEEDKEFVKSIYTQKEKNTLSDEEVQKRILEHFSKKRKMKDLIDEENKSSKNQIQERKESIKKKRAEEEEKRRIQDEEEQQKQEEQEEEHRKALSRAYRNNEMVKSSSLIRKHQADQARMAIVVEEGKSKVKDQIKEKKKRKMQQENGYGAGQS